MFVVGLTGSVSTGKTSVAQMFKDKGAVVIDADQIVHQLLKPTGGCYKSVIKAFGDDVLTEGRLDKKKLAGIVFKDKKELRKLEKIIHPKVQATFKAKLRTLKASKKIVVLDIPLLFESKGAYEVDTIVVVKTTQANQIERAVKNLKITKAEALRRIRAQMPLEDKIRRADFIIDNNKNLNQTKNQVSELWQKLLKTKS